MIKAHFFLHGKMLICVRLSRIIEQQDRKLKPLNCLQHAMRPEDSSPLNDLKVKICSDQTERNSAKPSQCFANDRLLRHGSRQRGP